jgi:hypothetical protein
LARNFQALHFGLQGSALQAKSTGGPVRSGEYASGFTEHPQDVLPLSVIQALIVAGSGRGSRLHFR